MHPGNVMGSTLNSADAAIDNPCSKRRADIWIGDYPSAIVAFREALALAEAPDDRRAASIGLAKALNADERYGEALSLASPYGSGSLEPTIESLRAEKALRLEDLSPPLVGALPGPARLIPWRSESYCSGVPARRPGMHHLKHTSLPAPSLVRRRDPNWLARQILACIRASWRRRQRRNRIRQVR